jgi:hypothetical protein
MESLDQLIGAFLLPSFSFEQNRDNHCMCVAAAAGGQSLLDYDYKSSAEMGRFLF